VGHVHGARRNLEALGISNVLVVAGDGSRGWPEEAPYEAIIVAAAAPDIPQPLLEQLADGGRLVLPMGDRWNQRLTLIERRGSQLVEQMDDPCRFVPLLGHHGFEEEGA